MKTSKTTCKTCDTPLLVGRSNKKYCSDLCRSRFNNKRVGQSSILYKKGMFIQMVTDSNQMENAIINEIQVAVRQYGYTLKSIQIEKL